MIHLISLINFFFTDQPKYIPITIQVFPNGHEWAWKFYPRNTRVNIGPPIIPAGEKIKFRIPRWNSDLKPKNMSHINFRPCGYTVSTTRSRGESIKHWHNLNTLDRVRTSVRNRIGHVTPIPLFIIPRTNVRPPEFSDKGRFCSGKWLAD